MRNDRAYRIFGYSAERWIIALVLLASGFNPSFSQEMTAVRKGSYHTYVYRVSNDIAREIYKNKYQLNELVSKEPIEIFPTDSIYRKKLTIGHYVFLRARESRLEGSLQSVNNIQLNILNNHRDLVMVFSDSTGVQPTGLMVTVGRRSVDFDSKVNAYRVPKSNFHGIVEVQYMGHTSYFSVERRYNNPATARWWKGLKRTFPFNHLISIIEYPIDLIADLIRGYGARAPGIYYRIKGRSSWEVYTGYSVTNKPKYKPGDTVRVKAFLTNRKGKPVTDRLNVLVGSGYGEEKRKHIMEVAPYRDGGYAFDLVLHDSLKLKLDSYCHLLLQSLNGKRSFYETFRIEAYELKKNSYSIRSGPKEAGIPSKVYVSGEDANGLPVYDAELNTTYLARQASKVYPRKLFVRDTLWTERKVMDPVGETVLQLPDSTLPDAVLEYQAVISASNAELETTRETESLSHDKRALPVKHTVRGDSIYFHWTKTGFEKVPLSLSYQHDEALARYRDYRIANEYLERGEMPKPLTISHLQGEHQILLPYGERIDPFCKDYRLRMTQPPFGMQAFTLEDESDGVVASAYRSKDSLFVEVLNPHRLDIRYYLFHNQALKESGSSTAIQLKRSSSASGVYWLSLQYVWGGKPETGQYQIDYDSRGVSIQLQHPKVIYPGQKALIDIQARDANEKPIEGVDVTAWATTSKMKSEPIFLPDFSKGATQRRVINEFDPASLDDRSSTWLSFSRWGRRLGLDTLAYYKFLNPLSGYFESRVKSRQTQMAAFVVRNGSLEGVKTIEVDGQPAFWAGAFNQPYSMRVSAGTHKIAIRSRRALIILPSVRVAENERLLFSIDLDHLPPDALVTKMPYNLTRTELAKLKSHYVQITAHNRPTGYPYREVSGYLRQGDHYFRIRSGAQTIGPLFPGMLEYVQMDSLTTNFTFQPGHEYALLGRTVTLMKEGSYHWINRWATKYDDADGEALTREDFEKSWEAEREKLVIPYMRFSEELSLEKGKIGRLTFLELPLELKSKTPLAVMILNLDKPDVFSVQPYIPSQLPLTEGRYHIVAIYRDKQYLLADSVEVRPYGTNYYRLDHLRLHPKDTFSLRVHQTIRKWVNEQSYALQERQLELQRIRESYYQNRPRNNYPVSMVVGRVTASEDGGGLPGVNVLVKGTVIGTITDADGFYELQCPPGSALVFSFIGYASQEVEVGHRSVVDMGLTPDVKQLAEVVVTGQGYYMMDKRALGYSVQGSRELAGKIPGVTIRGNTADLGVAGTATETLIRGMANLKAQQRALRPTIILDGKVIEFEALAMDRVKSSLFIEPEDAVMRFGPAFGNGLYLLSTRPNLTPEQLNEMTGSLPSPVSQASSANSLRRNFRDYAFWKPNLRTDENGKVSFEATFPDDITGWNAHVIGMTRHRSAQTSGFIQSFKPLIAEVAQPSFLVRGDSTIALGKITNFMPDSIKVRRSLTVNSNPTDLGEATVSHTRIDSIHLSAVDTDTLTVRYTMKTRDYEDGELRGIPIYRVGLLERQGEYFAFSSDSAVTVSLPSSRGDIKIIARAHPVDVLLDEVAFLKGYRYECNEQLASRLFGLLVERKVQLSRDKKSTVDRDINKVIRKLVSNQNPDGSWSWWGYGSGTLWITMHVAKALTLASMEGFDVAIQLKDVLTYATKYSEVSSDRTRLEAWKFILAHGGVARANDVLSAKPVIQAHSLYDSLLIQHLRQSDGVAPDWSWIMRRKSEKVTGELYWGSTGYGSIVSDATQCTLLVHEMMGRDKGHEKELKRIRNYFLSERRDCWRNTYESSMIVHALLPAFLQEDMVSQKPELTLSGPVQRTIQQFPFEASFPATSPLHIMSKGSAPIYVSAHQEYWESKPSPSQNNFVVKSEIVGATGKMKAGRLYNLRVTVVVKKDAEYVMIEAPIPAGCSYSSRPQKYSNGEVHREYYSHKTNIYCESLRAGTYTYEIPLLPRFAGSYTLNPAVALCMYLPTIKGQEGMKRVTIR